MILKKSNKFLLTIILSVAVVVSASFSSNLYAKPSYQGVSYYQGVDSKWYYAKHITDDVTGYKWTEVWVYPEKMADWYEGHITPNIGIVRDNGTVLNKETLLNVKLTVSGIKQINYEISNDNIGINVKIIDSKTGYIVKEIVVNSSAYIDISDLKSYKTYFILSNKNLNGKKMTHIRSFIMNDSQVFLNEY